MTACEHCGRQHRTSGGDGATQWQPDDRIYDSREVDQDDGRPGLELSVRRISSGRIASMVLDMATAASLTDADLDETLTRAFAHLKGLV